MMARVMARPEMEHGGPSTITQRELWPLLLTLEWRPKLKCPSPTSRFATVALLVGLEDVAPRAPGVQLAFGLLTTVTAVSTIWRAGVAWELLLLPQLPTTAPVAVKDASQAPATLFLIWDWTTAA
ncbi:hypothetical protein Vretimale_2857 [Volvox reticuliferus]|uniref:Uncharacterized protein n=1 Tax=Volvox reticuliferus TaxID=1737510 RepID=A0A8J4G0T1_9CHLO|nr:hypothetical protein Vretimale_2857 [Volvox reticuliferus]